MRLTLELFVADISRSVAFYAEVLGFRVIKQKADGYTLLAKGDVNLALNDLGVLDARHPVRPTTGERMGRGVEIAFSVADIRAAYGQVKASGWPLSTDLTDRPWGLTDFRLVDPDGYYIRVTSEA